MKIYQNVLLAFAISLLSACSDSDDDLKIGSCSAQEANEELFSFLQEAYFWNDELPSSINPTAYDSLAQAMYELRNEKDRFSFVLTDEEYEDYANSIFFGYGFGHEITEGQAGLRIKYVFDAGSAAQGGLRRGDVITKVDDTLISDFIIQYSSGSADYTDLFGPNEDGYSVNVTFEKPDGTEINADFEKGSIEANTVMASEVKQITVNNVEKSVAYMVFDSFKESSKTEINTAFTYFKDTAGEGGIDEMILDLRYNGGGLISTANQLSTQIAGNNVTDEPTTFVAYRFNENLSGNNQDVLFSLGEGIDQLNLDKLIVLTTEGSCSASELVINALSPHIDVTIVGDTTCGKPIGMSPEPICEHVVFAINFQTVNSAGYGDYFDGLPADCSVEDVVTGDWGDESDPILAEGLNYLKTGQCSTQSVSATSVSKKKVRKDVSLKDMMLHKDAI